MREDIEYELFRQGKSITIPRGLRAKSGAVDEVTIKRKLTTQEVADSIDFNIIEEYDDGVDAIFQSRFLKNKLEKYYMNTPLSENHISLMTTVIMRNLHIEDNYDVSNVDELELAKILNEKYKEYLG